MSVDTGNIAIPSGDSRLFSISRRKFELGLLWFAIVISGFVLFEPAPFDFVALILIGTWLFSGLHIPKTLKVPLTLLAILSATGLFAAFLSETLTVSGRHILITIYLYILTVGLAAYIARDPQRALTVIMNGYIWAAFLATIAGVIGYFSIVDRAHDLFVYYERARGTFKDPNVFGAFLVVPVVYIFIRHLTGEERLGGLQSGILAVLGLGLLLSFSRGAWVSVVLSASLSTYLLFVSAKSNGLRLKVLVLTVCLALIGAMLLVFAMSFDGVSELMDTRAQLVQSYDVNERFVGAGIALDLMLKHPFGIGAGSFALYHEAEPHNVYMYSFIIGGWIGGFSYICLVLYTVYIGLCCALREGPLRPIALVLFSTFLAVALEGAIIDTDHWRHFYILMACIWGLHCYMQKEQTISSTETHPEDRPDTPIASQGSPKRGSEQTEPLRRLSHTENRVAEVNTPPTPSPAARKAWRRRLGGTAACTHRNVASSLKSHAASNVSEPDKYTAGHRVTPTSYALEPRERIAVLRGLERIPNLTKDILAAPRTSISQVASTHSENLCDRWRESPQSSPRPTWRRRLGSTGKQNT